MKEVKHVLYISSEIFPYTPETQMSATMRKLPEQIQSFGWETRTFMPKFGVVNERRNQLHEVIRLSGMNLIIDDTDHPLIIKVASIQAARVQVYFIDNEDYFRRKGTLANENGEEYPDNDERVIFFNRGVMETVKKLRWTPDIIHCCGWITALAPLYIKKAFNDDPFFRNTKVIYSLVDDDFSHPFRKTFGKKFKTGDLREKDIASFKNKEFDFQMLTQLAIDYSDGIVQLAETVNPQILAMTQESGKPFLPYYPQDICTAECATFYDSLIKK